MRQVGAALRRGAADESRPEERMTGMNYAAAFAIGGLVWTSVLLAHAEAPQESVTRARQASGELGRTLRGRLEAAVKSHSFTGALAVCQDEAPTLAKELSARLGVTVGRTALRVRNEANQADPWEQAGLTKLQEQLDAGVEPARAEVVEVFPGEIRFLKAIVTEPVCLVCHGEVLDPGLQQDLLRRYPADRATGFKAGQLRGAFTVRIPMP